MNYTIYDVAGIGIGPFNLGLAALTAPIEKLKCLFFDSKPHFSWHEGMLLDFAKMQVPFYADLVTIADPTSPYTYFSYLKKVNKLTRFAILEDHYITRIEYNAYCTWVAAQLPSLHFGCTVTKARYDDDQQLYRLEVSQAGTNTSYYARHIVIGVGSQPQLPNGINPDPEKNILHSSQYLHFKHTILQQKSTTIIGAGQSAAEIFYDLLLEQRMSLQQINWYTRSSRFHPMEASKLTFEMTSPDYIKYFYALPASKKPQILSQQAHLYKGINTELLSAIYTQLYKQTGTVKYTLSANCELKSIDKGIEHALHLHHTELNKPFTIHSGAVILATGYYPVKPTFLDLIEKRICYDDNCDYSVNENYAIDITGKEVFVQNADIHTHGFNAADLGMGPYRNAIIINTILGHEHYEIEDHIAFQSFNPFHSREI